MYLVYFKLIILHDTYLMISINIITIISVFDFLFKDNLWSQIFSQWSLSYNLIW